MFTLLNMVCVIVVKLVTPDCVGTKFCAVGHSVFCRVAMLFSIGGFDGFMLGVGLEQMF